MISVPQNQSVFWPLKTIAGTSLVAQWLRHHALNAGGLGFPGEGTKRHMLQLRVGMPL